MSHSKLILLIVGTFLLMSCRQSYSRIDGKGPIVEETFALTDEFDQLSVHSAWKVKLVKSDQTQMTVKTHENLLPLLNFSIKNEKLNIGLEDNISLNSIKTQEIILYYKHLSAIKVASAASVSSEELFEQSDMQLNASSAGKIQLQLKTKNVQLKTSSASSIYLAGTSINCTATASSASSIKAGDFKAKNATIKTSSAGNIDLQVVEELNAQSSSGSSITYKGDPIVKSLTTSSGGKINKNPIP